MIGISRLYCGAATGSDAIRYGRRPGAGLAGTQRKPVVVWNCTKRCNLACRHCYSASTDQASDDELTGAEARAMIEDLAQFGCPALLFSGGEPLARPDVVDLIATASRAGIAAVLSTNGTLVSPDLARRLADAGLSYVGVSLDGLAGVNDDFRGVKGAFDRALGGVRDCRAAGLKVGLRLTMNRGNVADIPAIFDLVRREGVGRLCFYHLVYSGRASRLHGLALSHEDTRRTLDLIMDRTAAMHAAGQRVEVLTVDNHADGPYVYLRLLRQDPERARECLALLKRAGGNGSGVAIGCVSWNGDVLPDQFWRQRVIDNVRRRRFSEIWSAPTGDASGLLGELRDRKKHLKGRCRACRFLDVCNGNLRARAEAETGDCWGDDPACYLTDGEIAEQGPAARRPQV